jgi:hypothetical protein
MSEIQLWMKEQHLAAKRQYRNTNQRRTSPIPSMPDTAVDYFIEKHPLLIYGVVMRCSQRVARLTASHQVYAYTYISYH